MQLIQFMIPGTGRRVGLIDGTEVIDLTSGDPDCAVLLDIVNRAFDSGQRLTAIVEQLACVPDLRRLLWLELLEAAPNSDGPFLLPPLDHPESSRLHITGTGLTHLGSVQSRDQMHGGLKTSEPQTDSARMFAMGLQGGRPADHQRGVSPEWFYKGNGTSLRGHNAFLEIPAWALDGGEEPEIAGCYVIDPQGRPRRLGFALGNEWSDHATEKINYLYLAPSKLRMCALGPSLRITKEFDEVRLRCTVHRGAELLYDSGELLSGEQHMCHSLRNIEDHHFKYPGHRRPGDVHIHFFGTSKLSYSSRKWTYQPGDKIRIEAPGFSEPLVTVVSAGDADEHQLFMAEPL